MASSGKRQKTDNGQHGFRAMQILKNLFAGKKIVKAQHDKIKRDLAFGCTGF